MKIKTSNLDSISVKLPWPPSANQAYRMVNNRMLKSKPFREYVKALRGTRSFDFGESRLSVTLLVYPPDKRRRDLDNLGKVLCDSLQSAGYFKDDSQIDELIFKRMEVSGGGYVEAKIEKIKAMDASKES